MQIYQRSLRRAGCEGELFKKLSQVALIGKAVKVRCGPATVRGSFKGIYVTGAENTALGRRP